jgi:hypothetical protein
MPTPTSLAGIPKAVDRQKPEATALLNDLRALRPPSSQSRNFGEFVSLLRRQLRYLDTERKDAASGNAAAYRTDIAASARVRIRQR